MRGLSVVVSGAVQTHYRIPASVGLCGLILVKLHLKQDHNVATKQTQLYPGNVMLKISSAKLLARAQQVASSDGVPMN